MVNTRWRPLQLSGKHTWKPPWGSPAYPPDWLKCYRQAVQVLAVEQLVRRQSVPFLHSYMRTLWLSGPLLGAPERSDSTSQTVWILKASFLDIARVSVQQQVVLYPHDRTLLGSAGKQATGRGGSTNQPRRLSNCMLSQSCQTQRRGPAVCSVLKFLDGDGFTLVHTFIRVLFPPSEGTYLGHSQLG